MFWGELGQTPLSSSSPKNIQHIQHIQHFCSFKHILIQHASPGFNIFNISPERSTFLRKCVPFRGNVEYVECFGENLAKPPLSSSSPKNIQHIQHIQHFCSFKHILIQHAPPGFNIFNISPERSTFPRKCVPFRGNVEYVEFWCPIEGDRLWCCCTREGFITKKKTGFSGATRFCRSGKSHFLL